MTELSANVHFQHGQLTENFPDSHLSNTVRKKTIKLNELCIVFTIQNASEECSKAPNILAIMNVMMTVTEKSLEIEFHSLLNKCC